MGCGKSKEACAVAPLPARQAADRVAQLIPADPAPAAATLGVGHAGAESSRDQPATVEAGAASGTDGAASPPVKHAPGSGHPPSHRPTLPPPVEARGGKLGAFASMVRTMPHVVDTQLERSLEDVTGPIDPQQVRNARSVPRGASGAS